MGQVAIFAAVGASIFFQVRAGQAAEVEVKIAESAEKSKARGLEVESRRRLVEALANQNAIRGAQGIGVGFGSVAAVTAGDAARAAFDRATIRVNSLVRLRQFKARRRLIRRQTAVGIATTLFTFAAGLSARGTIPDTGGGISGAPKVVPSRAIPARGP